MSGATVQKSAETFTRVPASQLPQWVELLERAADIIDIGDHIVTDSMYCTAKALVDRVADEMYGASDAAASAAWAQVLERRRAQ